MWKNTLTMHGPMNVKFIKAKHTKEIHQYRNIKRKLLLFVAIVCSSQFIYDIRISKNVRTCHRLPFVPFLKKLEPFRAP
jgi:hypothetical protein